MFQGTCRVFGIGNKNKPSFNCFSRLRLGVILSVTQQEESGSTVGGNKSEMCLFSYYRGAPDACHCCVLFITLKTAFHKSSVSVHPRLRICSLRLKRDKIDSVVANNLFLLHIIIIITRLPVSFTPLALYVQHMNACG